MELDVLRVTIINPLTTPAHLDLAAFGCTARHGRELLSRRRRRPQTRPQGAEQSWATDRPLGTDGLKKVGRPGGVIGLSPRQTVWLP